MKVDGVFVPAGDAAGLLELARREIGRRLESGEPIPESVRRLLGELGAVAGEHRRRSTSADSSATPTGVFRGPMMDTMTTPQAANHLGISERGVRYRIATGALPATKNDAGYWHIQIEVDR